MAVFPMVYKTMMAVKKNKVNQDRISATPDPGLNSDGIPQPLKEKEADQAKKQN